MTQIWTDWLLAGEVYLAHVTTRLLERERPLQQSSRNVSEVDLPRKQGNSCHDVLQAWGAAKVRGDIAHLKTNVLFTVLPNILASGKYR